MTAFGPVELFAHAWQDALDRSGGVETILGCPPVGEQHPLLDGVRARMRVFITDAESDAAAFDITVDHSTVAMSLPTEAHPDVAVQVSADGVRRWLGEASCLFGDLEWRTLRFNERAEQLAALSVIEGALWLSGLTDPGRRP